MYCVGHFSKDKRNYFAFQIWKDAFLKGFKSNMIFVGTSGPQNYEVDLKIKRKIINEAKKLNNKSIYILLILKRYE